jgi:hypothetical protein
MIHFSAKYSQLSRNKIFAMIFRLFALLFSIWGILAITGVFKNAFNPVALLAYTIQSNILTAIFFGILLTRTVLCVMSKKNHPSSIEKPYGFFPRLSAFVSVAIFVTMVVFWLILAPSFQGANMIRLLALDNLAVHLITPLLMLIDYILFTERGKLKKYDPLLCAIIPYAYLLEAMTLGLTHTVKYDSLGIHSYYPYMFLDIDRFGAWVILMILAITLFFLLIIFVWRRFDNKLGHKTQI